MSISKPVSKWDNDTKSPHSQFYSGLYEKFLFRLWNPNFFNKKFWEHDGKRDLVHGKFWEWLSGLLCVVIHVTLLC